MHHSTEAEAQHEAQAEESSGALQEGFPSSFRHVFLSLLVLGGIFAFYEIGAVQSQWQATAMMDQMSKHDSFLARGLQSSPSTAPAPPAKGLKVTHVDIESTVQDGLSINVNVPIAVRNDMSDSFKHNNGAVSKEGSVERLNGVFNDNNIGSIKVPNLKSVTTELSKVEDKVGAEVEAAKKNVDGKVDEVTNEPVEKAEVMEENRAAMKASNEDSSTNAFKYLRDSQESAKAAPTQVLGSFMKQLEPLLKVANIKGSIDLDELKKTNYAEASYYKIGPEKTASKTAAKVRDLMADEITAKQLGRSERIHEVNMKTNNDVKGDLGASTDGDTTGGNLNDITDSSELLADLVKSAGKAGPVEIADVSILHKKQRGLQINFATDIDVSNNMENSFRHNNGAVGKTDVIRINGVADQNEVTNVHIDKNKLKANIHNDKSELKAKD